MTTPFMTLNQLGLTRVKTWEAALREKAGLYLICGPAGSGRTTTSNASVLALNLPPRQPRQAQDRVPGVQLLESLAGPGVVVGEVRDPESARIAVRAAQAGARVLVELHSPSILSSFSSLAGLGVKGFELRQVLRGAIAQRLYDRRGAVVGRSVVSEVAHFPHEHDVLSALDGEIDWPTMLKDGRHLVKNGSMDPGQFEALFGDGTL